VIGRHRALGSFTEVLSATWARKQKQEIEQEETEVTERPLELGYLCSLLFKYYDFLVRDPRHYRQGIF
jgi:hypothetical protein